MILFLAGTSDARELALQIKDAGFRILATVVTESAAKSLQESGLETRIGRLTAADMTALIEQKGIQAVVDASHPFAEEASKNALQAANAANVPYIRYEREQQQYNEEKLIVVRDYEAAAKLAAEKRGVIMLTTGSKTLEIFVKELTGLENTRVIARMLPRLDNMEKCALLGIEQKNIVAIQGPFSKELNKALYQHYGVTLMITKESGKASAVDEKIEAALECGIETILIARPAVKYQNLYSNFAGVLNHLNNIISN
jgi:precorrin-6A/cobalt-precorrin-6A reductase